MDTYGGLLILFAAIWVVTFFPAWWLLLRLLAMSASPRRLGAKFWVLLLIYRVVISAPYIALLIFGEALLNDVVEAIIIGFLVTSFILSIIRFGFRTKIITSLWWLYGYFYDGLLHLVPYQRLIKEVVGRAKKVKPNPKKVLEIGSGTGNVLVTLRAQYPEAELQGVDSSSTMTRIAQKKFAHTKGVEITREDAMWYLTNASDKSYDLIVMQNVVYAIGDRPRLWREALRALKNDGAIVVTNSDRAGNSTIMKEHMQHGSFFSLLHPKLIAVGITDSFISHLSKAGSFHFTSAAQLKSEIEAAGGTMSEEVTRCYGGVNILFDIRKDKKKTAQG